MCELLPASFPIQPCVAVSKFDRVLEHRMHQWPLMCLTSLTWGFHPQPLPISWDIHLSSVLSFQLCYIVGDVFLSSLCSCLLAEPCSTVTALCSTLPLAAPDRSSRIDLYPSHQPAFSSLGLLMDLGTSSQVCPPCSDPMGLCPAGEGSLRTLASALRLLRHGWGQLMLPPKSCRDWMTGVDGMDVGLCDQQLETGMLKLWGWARVGQSKFPWTFLLDYVVGEREVVPGVQGNLAWWFTILHMAWGCHPWSQVGDEVKPL